MRKEHKLDIISEGQKNGISSTCRKYDISRTLYYRWLKRYKTHGIEGLDDIKRDYIPINKTKGEIELAVLNLIRLYPHYGPRTIKYLLEELGHHISESAVFNIMKRNHLTNKNNRVKFANKKAKETSQSFPPTSELKSGECLVFWITDYGFFEHIGHLYEYTICELKSRIACTRLYNDISYSHFEDLLTAVAIPVSQTLNFNTNYLCFFQDSKIIPTAQSKFKSKVFNTIKEIGFNVTVHVLTDSDEIKKITEMRNQYTERCLSFLMPLINEGIHFTELKSQFQNDVIDYNTKYESIFDNERYIPIEYHNKLTNTKWILPLWAYLYRPY